MTTFTTFTAFGGADMISTINGIPLTEVGDIKYQEDLMQPRTSGPNGEILPPISGQIYATAFGERESSVRTAAKGFNDTFILFFANETGSKSSIEFEGFQLMNRQGGFAVDEVMFSEIYHFTAHRIGVSNAEWKQTYSKGVPVIKYSEPEVAVPAEPETVEAGVVYDSDDVPVVAPRQDRDKRRKTGTFVQDHEDLVTEEREPEPRFGTTDEYPKPRPRRGGSK